MNSIIILFTLFVSCYSSAVYQVPAVIQAPVSIPTVVKTGVSHHAYTVPESRFTRTDWETPGAAYAIPAVAQYTVTRPGFTTYHEGPTLHSTSYAKTSIPVATVTAHQPLVSYAAAPAIHAAPLVHAAPIAKAIY